MHRPLVILRLCLHSSVRTSPLARWFSNFFPPSVLLSRRKVASPSETRIIYRVYYYYFFYITAREKICAKEYEVYIWAPWAMMTFKSLRITVLDVKEKEREFSVYNISRIFFTRVVMTPTWSRRDLASRARRNSHRATSQYSIWPQPFSSSCANQSMCFLRFYDYVTAALCACARASREILKKKKRKRNQGSRAVRIPRTTICTRCAVKRVRTQLRSRVFTRFISYSNDICG